MKKIILITTILIVTIILSGCSKTKYLTNEEIIKEVKKCEDNGLKANTYPHSLIKVKSVHCGVKN